MHRVSLFAFATALLLAHPAAIPAQEKTMTTSTGIELVWIPPGEFMMGSKPSERGTASNEGDQPRKTTIKQGFWMGRTELTVAQWRKFVDTKNYVTDAEKEGRAFAPKFPDKGWAWVKGANWKDPKYSTKIKDNYPVTCVSWNDAVAFCQWLTAAEKQANKLPAAMVYRLPTEAEWEYACRAGTQSKFWWGEKEAAGENRLNWRGSQMGTGYDVVTPVDHFKSRGRNKFGLADMLGNVREWCLDGYDEQQAHEEPWSINAPAHVVRAAGGDPQYCRCASRMGLKTTNACSGDGFRVCCGVPR